MTAKSNKAPLNVLYVENGIGYGGAIICLRHLVSNLDRERIEPFVVTGRTGPDYEPIANEANWRWIRDRYVDTVGMREKLDKASWPSRIPGLRWILSQCIARTDDVVNFVPFFIRILLHARRNRIDLIHVNNEPICNRAALMAAKVLRIPTVCHVRGQQTGSRSIRWFYTLPDHFICVSNWVSEGIGRLGVKPERRTVIYDGIPLEKLDINTDGKPFREKYGIGDNDFAVGLVGLLIPWKGQELFLDAAKKAVSEIPNLKMLIVGGTPEECEDFERHIRARIVQEGLSDHVVLTGHQSDMMCVYNGLDVAVSASTMPEPLGTMVIETMAMGRPLIAPNHGGAAEMATDRETALLFEPGSVDGLGQAIRELSERPELRSELGIKAREAALAAFSIRQHVERVTDVYGIAEVSSR